MNNDKTLADAQPGGRVRLGDSLPPLPKMQRFTNLYGETYAYSAEQMREYARAALSAQPTPGGQDPHEMADALERIASGSLSDYEGVDADELHILRCAKLIRDLAARQPVGEPTIVAHRYIQRHQSAEHSVWLSGDADETYVEAERQGLGRIERAYACPPAQAVDLEQFRSPIEEWRYDMEKWVKEHGDPGGAFTSDLAEADRLLALIDSQAVGNG